MAHPVVPAEDSTAHREDGASDGAPGSDGEVAATPAQPRQVTIIKPTSGLASLKLDEAWRARELLLFLIWRDVKVRYKQTTLGAGWAFLQPLMTILIFTAIFSVFAKIPSEGFPYPIFAFAGLLPWLFFSQAVNRGAGSLLASADLVSKIYFPRLILPVAAVITPIADFALAMVILVGMMAWFTIVPTAAVLALPLFFLFALLTALTLTLWLSAVNVKYRDVGYTIPFMIQTWMYLSPILYPLSLVPEKWQFLYSLNPMASVIVGFRWGLLGTDAPDVRPLAISLVLVTALFCGGLAYFTRTERTFADVI